MKGYMWCPDCGGRVTMENGYWICTAPGTCTWTDVADVNDDLLCDNNGVEPSLPALDSKIKENEMPSLMVNFGYGSSFLVSAEDHLTLCKLLDKKAIAFVDPGVYKRVNTEIKSTTDIPRIQTEDANDE
ncbi:hypothetical protein UFOVP1138_56 [uncultured Caudovirales phage]|uniref:Uncharacterized protein n=1 Tax=uncultured Caudovirales phage TaxID=2100421 RepID=A0A6J5QY31_9CAUD|nr:hypothetical protein UFOVP975_64 [uncultured Caudovirales phage]CAB4186281.1 hypothetical protein UFOVP1138_56 [uncultured Caudovirales phage]CAB4204433.1 hypothetical protein UFOVP1394_53 [uncultured Caudovirales phage]